MKTIIAFALIAAISLAGCGEKPSAGTTPERNAMTKNSDSPKANPQVRLQTSFGEIVVELYAKEAPISTANFLGYVNGKFYDGTLFHRVIPGFMIQCGGMDKNMNEKPNKQAPIKNEADNGLKNLRGTLAMARTQEVDSATSQFFINLKDNSFLDHGYRDFGYAVFGKVVSGMDVVDKIAAVQTGSRGYHEDVPLSPITIDSASVK